jgi:hypothetical protein
MNYKLIYDQLVKRGQQRPKLKGYTENHHIIPRCVGGSDDAQNLVSLSAREHFIAHRLLVKIYPKQGGLWTALMMMYGFKSKYNNVLTSKQYQTVREKWIEYKKVDRSLRNCKTCNIDFTVKTTLKQRFCCQRCYYDYKKKLQSTKVIKTCPQCNIEFKISAYRNFKTVCCSVKCAGEYKTKTQILMNCPICEKEFVRRISYIKLRLELNPCKQFFCSRTCSYNSRHKNL